MMTVILSDTYSMVSMAANSYLWLQWRYSMTDPVLLWPVILLFYDYGMSIVQSMRETCGVMWGYCQYYSYIDIFESDAIFWLTDLSEEAWREKSAWPLILFDSDIQYNSIHSQIYEMIQWWWRTIPWYCIFWLFWLFSNAVLWHQWLSVTGNTVLFSDLFGSIGDIHCLIFSILTIDPDVFVWRVDYNQLSILLTWRTWRCVLLIPIYNLTFISAWYLFYWGNWLFIVNLILW